MRGQQGAPSAPALDHGCPINRMKSGAVSLIVIMPLFVEVGVLFLFAFGYGWANEMHNLINRCCVISFHVLGRFFFDICVRALFNFVLMFVFESMLRSLSCLFCESHRNYYALELFSRVNVSQTSNKCLEWCKQ